jgi:hypothetical protein
VGIKQDKETDSRDGLINEKIWGVNHLEEGQVRMKYFESFKATEIL